MRERMEKLVVLPFSFGCASNSSVELGAPKGAIVPRRQTGNQGRSWMAKMKRSRPSSSSSGFMALSKPNNIAAGVKRFIKSLSQLFFYKEDDIEEKEPEMEIGYPTDVKHVTHIGLDGSTSTNNNVKGWDNLKAPELLSVSSILFHQFEVATHAYPTPTSPSSSNFG